MPLTHDDFGFMMEKAVHRYFMQIAPLAARIGTMANHSRQCLGTDKENNSPDYDATVLYFTFKLGGPTKDAIEEEKLRQSMSFKLKASLRDAHCT